ncbi:hypothetical protein [Tenacibaculum finnmarkense]|uniref:hypothetical protein n=1 Tax=Tenacibaculum finnmarkense TaxID=2781243 RepID=UPI001E560A7A|nr:hypothetical protein [Tenacibaculum finnmarkense]MCD8409357.1 hypothetical protein [Tenacibaculum finnmarkense genomovar ulcerans]
MKKSNLIFSVLLLAFLTLFTMVSCSEDPIPVVEMELNAYELTIKEKGEQGIISVLNGNGDYKVTSSDDKIAVAKIVIDKETKEVSISVKPITAGKVIISIEDSADKKMEVAVLVQFVDVAVEKSAVSLSVSDVATVKILAGSGKYEISVDNENATAEIVGLDIKITGKVLGESEVTLTDIITKKTAVITVKTIPVVKIEKSAVSLNISDVATVKILEGSGKYEISVDNENTTAEIVGLDIKITGKVLGESEVTLTDIITKKTAVITVKIIPVVKIEKSAVSLSISDVATVKILEGSGEYEISVDNKNATAEIVGTDIKITGNVAGKSKVTLTDIKTKKTAVITVEIVLVPEVFSDVAIEKSAVSFNVGDVTTVKILEGSGEYEISVDNKNATAEIVGTDIKITGNVAGKSKVTLTDIKTKKTAVITVEIVLVPEVFSDVAIEKSAVSFNVGDVTTVKILAGSGEYEISVDNKNATAEIVGKDIKITGNVAGKSKVTLTDIKTKKTAVITVEIVPVPEVFSDVAIEKSAVSFNVGDVTTVKILAGSGEYEISVDNKNATAEIVGKDIKITGKILGESKVTLTDIKTKKTAVITVEIVPVPEVFSDVAIEKSAVSFNVGDVATVKILAGSGEYEISVDNKNATAEIVGKDIKITGNVAGKSKVTLTDIKTKKTAVITVEIVPVPETFPDVAIEKSAVSFNVSDVATVKILAGSGEYEISVNNSNATAEIVGMDIKITGKILGESEVTLTDIKTQKTAVITVKIISAAELTLDKEKVEFILTQTGTVTILTGTAPFTVEDKYRWAPTASTFKIVNEQGEEDVNGSKIIFDSRKATIDSYKITDAKLKEIDLSVKVFKALNVSETVLEIPKGKSVEITLEGKIAEISVSSTNQSVATAEIKDEYGSSSRPVIIKTAQVGSAELTFTDGVTTQKVTVTVVAPNPLAIFNDDVEVNATTLYELEYLDLIIQGGIGEYEVTFSKENILTLDEIQQSPLDNSKYYLRLNRNFSVREAGEVVVTVSRKDNATDSKSFTVKYNSLIAVKIKINGVDLIKKESPEYGFTTPYFTVYKKNYDVYVALGSTVDFEILNTDGNCTLDASGYGSDRGEITGDAAKFSVKTLKTGNYYLSIKTPKNEQVLLITVRIQ